MRHLALALLLAAAGCDALTGSSAPDFGDRYRLQTVDRPTVALDGSRVVVPVEYGGGCAEHTFALRSRLDGDTATVWFEHDANGDACEALRSEVLEAELPAGAAATPHVVLRVPVSLSSDDEVAFELR